MGQAAKPAAGRSGQALGLTTPPCRLGLAALPRRKKKPCNDCVYCLKSGCVIGAKRSGIWPLNAASGRAAPENRCNVYQIGVDRPEGGRPDERQLGQYYDAN